MDLTINGKLVKVLEPQSGTSARGSWKKQSFIVETLEMYPKKVALVAWNERTEVLKNLTPGDELKISISIESREYNDRWYTDVRANDIVKVTGSASSVAPPLEAYNIQVNSVGLPPEPSSSTHPPVSDDDLPF